MTRNVVLVVAASATIVTLLSIACRDDSKVGGESDGSADSVFLPGLDPKIARQVAELRQKVTVDVNDATQERIGHLISDLGRDRETVESHGRRVSVEALALAELRKIGEAAIPQLVAAIGTHQNSSVRSTSLLNVCQLAKKDVEKLKEYLPVFVRSMWDKEARVRGAAVAQIGQAARAFSRWGCQEQLDLCTQYLVKALSDDAEGVQSHAATCLDVIGRIDLVPQEIREKYGTGGFRP
jgi:hypothetical protein